MNRPALWAVSLLLCAAPLLAAKAAPQPVPAGSATIGSITGEPQVLLDGVEPWVKAEKGMQLTPGSRVRTGAGSATLVFFDGSVVRVSDRAEFTVESAERSSISVFLNIGTLEAWVAKLSGRTFKTRTPTSVAAVRGTVFKIHTNGRISHIDLFQGRLAVNDNFGRSALLSSGHSVETGVTPASGSAPLKVTPLPKGTPVPPQPKIALAAPMPKPEIRQAAAGDKKGRDLARQQAAPPPPPPTEQVPAALSGDPAATMPPPPPPPSTQQNVTVAPISPSAP